MFNKIKSHLTAHPLAFLLLSSIVVFSIHMLTVGEYPAAWFDEIEIIEMGRFSVFNVKPEWSVNLLPAPNGALVPPSPYFHYLAGAILEALYRATDGFIAGRFVMLASLPLCAMALFAWLRGKGISDTVSFAVAMLFLVDPNATICAHWYRPDLWCLAMVLFGSLLIAKSRDSSHPALFLLFGGALGATAVFFWITSVLLMPLMLAELCVTYNPLGSKKKMTTTLKSLGLATIGGIIATAILLLPLYRHIPDIVEQYLTKSEIANMMSTQSDPLSATMVRLFDFVKIACRSPFTWSAALVGVFISRRNALHAVLFVATTVFILSTRVYHLRMVYLMPYVFLFAAISAEHLFSSTSKPVAVLSRLFVGGALCFGLALSVAALNFAAWPESNTLALFTEKLNKTIPGHKPKVCLLDFEHECYYAGRSLGWRMYSTSRRTEILEAPYANFLDNMDAIVVSTMLPLSDTEKLVIADHGFTKSTTIEMPPAATGPIKSKLAAIFYAHGYPTCEVLTR